MRFYSVAVASHRFHGDVLTYHATATLAEGTVVTVPLRNRMVKGVVLGSAPPPEHNTLAIESPVEGLVLPDSTLRLMSWMSQYYPGSAGVRNTLFLPSYVTSVKKKVTLSKHGEESTDLLPPLTPEQQRTMKELGSKPIALLHGDTGTGKTRIYAELSKQAAANGKSSLILVPEIALTPQLAAEFSDNDVIVMHSALTNTQRNAAWHKVLRATKPITVVGPRSALFLPFSKLGLIVVDECHDQAYKQDRSPFYLATMTAAQIGKIHGAQVVLGSATPSVTDYYFFENKKLPIVRLTEQAIRKNSRTIKELEIVSIRGRENFTRSAWLSNQLLVAVEQATAHKKQSLLFLNKRGTARTVVCENCGWQAVCPNCDLPMTYHGDSHRLVCHTCGYRTAASSCPVCNNTTLRYVGAGTKAIFTELQRLFPTARIARFDTDNTKSERLEENFSRLKGGAYDIIVGTQLLTKGLDLPLLTTVGVLQADVGLAFPDYTAEEKTFQQLLQIIGRVGRGHSNEAKIIIQTFQPDSPVIQYATKQDFLSFYKKELDHRKKFNYPPFCFALVASCTKGRQETAISACSELKVKLEEKYSKRIIVLGPSPRFVEKTSKGYSWQLLIKARNRGILTDITSSLPANWIGNLDPENFL